MIEELALMFGRFGVWLCVMLVIGFVLGSLNAVVANWLDGAKSTLVTPWYGETKERL